MTLWFSVMTLSADDDTRAALESLLHWYAAMGVDAAIDETPTDRFVAPNAAPTGPAPKSLPPRAPLASVTRDAPADALPASAEALMREAEARAAAAQDLETLQQSFAGQPGLALSTTARMIFSGGTAGSRLMLFGAAPESDDERQGAIMSGAAGRLLDAMLKAMGLDRSGVYLAHVVPWRPPGNRQVTPLELSLCLPYTRRHIALAQPEIILCLGERAAQPLLGGREPISRLRGRWLAYEGETQTTKLLATFSPGYLLSQPLQKRRAWVDLQMVMAALA